MAADDALTAANNLAALRQQPPPPPPALPAEQPRSAPQEDAATAQRRAIVQRLESMLPVLASTSPSVAARVAAALEAQRAAVEQPAVASPPRPHMEGSQWYATLLAQQAEADGHGHRTGGGHGASGGGMVGGATSRSVGTVSTADVEGAMAGPVPAPSPPLAPHVAAVLQSMPALRTVAAMPPPPPPPAESKPGWQ
jgi:uncharacterized membrane protein YgcG